MRSGSIIDKDGVGYSDSLDMLVVALCSDYSRRERSISGGKCSRRTAMEYKYINALILEGASEVVGTPHAETFIYEIGNRIGYAKSSLGFFSETAYKVYKQDVKIAVARKLHLLD